MTPDRITGWAVGAGIGSAVSIVTWVIASRLADLWLSVPLGPIIAFGSALIAGIGVALERGMSLSRLRPTAMSGEKGHPSMAVGSSIALIRVEVPDQFHMFTQSLGEGEDDVSERGNAEQHKERTKSVGQTEIGERH